jgi:IS605 OrfB family transposase
LLEKLEEAKEQRANQLAHQILALALGLRLKTTGPIKSEAEREHCDIHGEYERIPDSAQPDGFRRPVDFIVLEDLKYYETTRMRSRQVNVRLMRWCRRHFRDKLKQLCEVFGIPVVEANPANTSKFCARTGVAGFRAVEVGPGFEQDYVWRKALEKLEQHQSGKKKLEPDDLAFCEGAGRLMQQVREAQQIPTKSGKALPCPRTLLAPLGSGNVFVPIVGEVSGADLPPAVVQADVNAAVNLGLGVIADPQLWEIHQRVRTKAEKEEKPKTHGGKAKKSGQPPPQTSQDTKPRLRTAENRKFGKEGEPLELGNLQKSSAVFEGRKPNYFRDVANLSQATWDIAVVPDPANRGHNVTLASGKALWGAVRQLQWKRCLETNDARLTAWRDKANLMPD